MKVVILCGGKGMRMRGLKEDIPKALAKVNDKPIIWHIMQHYSQFGHNHFVLPLGYQGDKIKEYFMNYTWRNHNVAINLKEQDYHLLDKSQDWKILCIDTGQDTMTGARIKMLEEYIQDDVFCVTYGDGLSDINLETLLSFHKEKGKTVTVAGVKKNNQYGVLEVENGLAKAFHEKPGLQDIINGGFFICNKKFFEYLSLDPGCVLEEEPLAKLIEDNELAVYEHDGLWISIDTPKDLEEANKQWKNF